MRMTQRCVKWLWTTCRSDPPICGHSDRKDRHVNKIVQDLLTAAAESAWKQSRQKKLKRQWPKYKHAYEFAKEGCRERFKTKAGMKVNGCNHNFNYGLTDNKLEVEEIIYWCVWQHSTGDLASWSDGSVSQARTLVKNVLTARGRLHWKDKRLLDQERKVSSPGLLPRSGWRGGHEVLVVRCAVGRTKLANDKCKRTSGARSTDGVKTTPT